MTTPQGTGAPTNLCPLTLTLPMGLRKVTMGACVYMADREGDREGENSTTLRHATNAERKVRCLTCDNTSACVVRASVGIWPGQVGGEQGVSSTQLLTPYMACEAWGALLAGVPAAAAACPHLLDEGHHHAKQGAVAVDVKAVLGVACAAAAVAAAATHRTTHMRCGQ